MAVCIGGVCVPYTAVIPLIVLGLKWLVGQLGALGLMPKSLTDWANNGGCKQQVAPTKADAHAGPKCDCSGLEEVEAVESAVELDGLLNKGCTVVIKFTASWCKPCLRIHPYFARLGQELKDQGNSGTVFVTVDVDEVDELACRYEVAMMPTFIMARKEGVLGRYIGSSEPQLKNFIQEHL